MLFALGKPQYQANPPAVRAAKTDPVSGRTRAYRGGGQDSASGRPLQAEPVFQCVGKALPHTAQAESPSRTMFSWPHSCTDVTVITSGPGLAPKPTRPGPT